jgi:hypothetical protein
MHRGVGVFLHVDQPRARTRSRHLALARARVDSYGSRRCCGTDASIGDAPDLEETFDG